MLPQFPRVLPQASGMMWNNYSKVDCLKNHRPKAVAAAAAAAAVAAAVASSAVLFNVSVQ